jgi:hypothetical protein
VSRLADVELKEFLEEAAADIAQAYYHLICELFVNYYDEAMTNFTAHRTGLLTEFGELTKLASISFERVCVPLLAQFKADRNAYFVTHSLESEVRLSVTVGVFTGMLIDKPSQHLHIPNLEVFEIKVFRQFLKLFHRTGEEMYDYMERDGFLLEFGLLSLLRNLKATNFSGPTLVNSGWFRKLGRSFREIFLSLFDRVILSLRCRRRNRDLFLQGIQALADYFMPDDLPREIRPIIPLPPLRELAESLPLSDRQSRSPFLQLVSSKECPRVSTRK